MTDNPKMTDMIPSGCILLWYGAANSLPNGYQICDGTNGSPDLQDKFVVGAGATYSSGDSSDTGSNTLVFTSTTTVASAGDHNHQFPDAFYGNSVNSNGDTTVIDRNSTDGPWYTESSGTHTHAATTGTTATGTVIPPYYALLYIMKS